MLAINRRVFWPVLVVAGWPFLGWVLYLAADLCLYRVFHDIRWFWTFSNYYSFFALPAFLLWVLWNCHKRGVGFWRSFLSVFVVAHISLVLVFVLAAYAEWHTVKSAQAAFSIVGTLITYPLRYSLPAAFVLTLIFFLLRRVIAYRKATALE